MSDWNRDRRLAALIRLPWTVTVVIEDGDMVARVRELPDAIATGRDERELAKDLWDAVEASLAIRLDNGDEVPLPAGNRFPWEGPQASIKQGVILVDEPTRTSTWSPPGSNLVAA
jgi:predicted RNase H-like HicB family nuclease